MVLQVDVQALRSQLIYATSKLSKLCLFQSAKWCAEALNGLPKPTTEGQGQQEQGQEQVQVQGQRQATSSSIPIEQPEIEDVEDQDKILLAQTYFNCKEFERAAQILEHCKSGDAKFLRLYSMLISIDKRENERSDGLLIVGQQNLSNLQTLGQNDYLTNEQTKTDEFGNLSDSKLTEIVMESEEYLAVKENPFLYYLNGIIYRKKKKLQAAQRNLYQSLLVFPFNWSCWKELIDSFSTFEEADLFVARANKRNDVFSKSVMFHFFEMAVLQESQGRSPRLYKIIEDLEAIFPKFLFIKERKFLTLYKNLEYFEAEAIFDSILIEDPLRLDGLDIYSNMLYVMEKKSKLSYLAQYASQVDKFRPETCCVLANYYSINSEHEKSIVYYKRALMLDKNCLSAWTLMGHEFVELKNSHAAIECYRRAVDTNSKDFRAWYGLGQAYEVLDMHLYALYYYQRATNLQPLDKRMWQAIGNCYEKIGQLEDAIKSFEKALDLGKCLSRDDDMETCNQIPGDGIALEDGNGLEYQVEPHICYRLAILSQKLGDKKATYKYMKLCYTQEKFWGAGDESSRARIWLAKNALSNEDPSEAYEMVKDLNHSSAHEVEEARAIARDARNRMSK
ncbi:CDC23 [Candida oxycetoniae]|uniref:CDC23 n=1 Tax=Candida oxycetoniae TaxID=497107 RepID=A0AAI9SSY0_9ASCO|nr:CDC23 [Candida oxycetoniae]KAI3402311.2 CDC23 [Candida oxycetoniae]